MHTDPLIAVFEIALYLVLCLTASFRPGVGVIVSLLGLLFVPPFPEEDTVPWALIGYIGLAGGPIVIWLLRPAFVRRMQRENAGYFTRRVSRSIGTFLLVCLATFPLSILYNTSERVGDRFYLYARGLLPFMYLMMFFVVRDLKLSSRGLERLAKLMFAVCAAFAIKAYWIYLTTGERVTYTDAKLILPYTTVAGVFACAYMLSSARALPVCFWSSAFLFLAGAVVLAFTKAQLLSLCAGVLLAAVIAAVRRKHKRFICAAAVALLAAGVAAWYQRGTPLISSITSAWERRIEDPSSMESRQAEISIAMENFMADPLLGKGLGFQYSAPYYYAGPARVGYVHNAVAYFLMCTGSVGLLAYLWIFVSWGRVLIRMFRFRPHATDAVLTGLHGAVFSLFVYSMMFASFRTIQQNVILATCLALILGIQDREAPRHGSVPAPSAPYKRDPIPVARFERVPAPSAPRASVCQRGQGESLIPPARLNRRDQA